MKLTSWLDDDVTQDVMESLIKGLDGIPATLR
jgi:hypothetical protein